MIQFTDIDKRWLEIVFYFLCRKVFSINLSQQDVIDFIKGYRWTNMFDYDILVKTITEEKILLNDNFIPKRQEFLMIINNDDCRLRISTQTYKTIRELIRDTEYKFDRREVFHAQMKDEINKTEFFPRITSIPKVHETIYSFLLAIRYIADIIKHFKF